MAWRLWTLAEVSEEAMLKLFSIHHINELTAKINRRSSRPL